MYKAFLSFAQLREYLTMLQDNGLIEYEGGKRTYRTTEKGKGLLQIYEKMYELAPPLATTVETSISEHNRIVNSVRGGRY
jgi:DNA-binding PadR family transcriptional regulator